MQFLPIVQRELLVASRKRATYLSRTLSAGILLAFYPALLSSQSARPGMAGMWLLQFLSAVVFLECVLAGVRYTADCLSEEKREGTLGLLFLTNLGGFDVVAGKMVAHSIPAIFNLVAAIPILSLTVLSGGVTGDQIVALSIALLVITIFSLCVGTFISSRGAGERAVLVGSLFFLILISLLPLLVQHTLVPLFNFLRLNSIGSLTLLTALLDLAPSVQNFSPLFLLNQALRGLTTKLIPAISVLTVSSVLLLAYASWRVRHSFGDPEIPHHAGRAQLRRRINRRALVQFWRDPLLWLALEDRANPARIALFCVGVIFFGIFVRVGLENSWMWVRPLAILGTYGVHVLYKFLVVAETSRQLNHDKRSGALELLLATPVTDKAVAGAQTTATFRVWFWPAVSVAIMNLAWMTEKTFMRDMFILLPCSIVLLGFDTYALAWRSVLNALKGDRYVRTVCVTFFRVIAPPMAAIMITLAFCMGAAVRSGTLTIVFTLWTLGSIVYDLSIAANARIRLKNIRSLVSDGPAHSSLRLPFRLAPLPSLSRPEIPHPA